MATRTHVRKRSRRTRNRIPLRKKKPFSRKIARRKKVRLAVECTPEERKYMKMLAALEEITLNELILESVKRRFPKCPLSHVPNKKTAAVLQSADKKKDLIHFDSVDDFLKSLDS